MFQVFYKKPSQNFHISSQDIACAYVEEALACTNTVLHCIYMEPSELDVPNQTGQYADPDNTADYLRELAHRVRGRFHWVKSNGNHFMFLKPFYCCTR